MSFCSFVIANHNKIYGPVNCAKSHERFIFIFHHSLQRTLRTLAEQLFNTPCSVHKERRRRLHHEPNQTSFKLLLITRLAAQSEEPHSSLSHHCDLHQTRGANARRAVTSSLTRHISLCIHIRMRMRGLQLLRLLLLFNVLVVLG